MTPAYPSQKAAMKRRYAELKAMGVCVACAKVPAIQGRTQCADCRDRLAAARASSKENHRVSD